MDSAVQQFAMKPENDDVLGMPFDFSGCTIWWPVSAGQHVVQWPEVRGTTNGRHYRGPELRGAKHRVGFQNRSLRGGEVA